MMTPGTRPAGTFSTWLRRLMKLDRDATRPLGFSIPVPCGDCTICCRCYSVEVSAKYDPVDTYETEPGPEGSTILKRHDDGTCGYWNGASCSIYPRRPQNCRLFDCRIMAYAGVTAPPGHALNEAILQWNPRSFAKTREDTILLTAFRTAVQEAIRQGWCLEDACRIGFRTFRNYLPLAKTLYDERKS